jgi:hypothetical protein
MCTLQTIESLDEWCELKETRKGRVVIYFVVAFCTSICIDGTKLPEQAIPAYVPVLELLNTQQVRQSILAATPVSLGQRYVTSQVADRIVA